MLFNTQAHHAITFGTVGAFITTYTLYPLAYIRYILFHPHLPFKHLVMAGSNNKKMFSVRP